MRTCLCSYGEICRDAFRHFVDAGDSKWCGYFYVPSASKQKHRVEVIKKQRQSIYNCLLSSGRMPPHQVSQEFVAYHHFHPEILQPGNKGPITDVDVGLAKKIGLHKSDLMDPNRKIYFPAPNYSEKEWNRDSLSALESMRPVADFILDDDGTGDKSAHSGIDSTVTEDDRSSHWFSLRPSPFLRKVQATFRWVKANPIEASVEIVKLREKIDRTAQMLRLANSRIHHLASQLKEQKQKLELAMEIQHE